MGRVGKCSKFRDREKTFQREREREEKEERKRRKERKKREVEAKNVYGVGWFQNLRIFLHPSPSLSSPSPSPLLLSNVAL